MAFKMTFPTIKGSPVHKTSTTTPTVSMSRTQADPSLVAAASEMGKSNVPGAIDYTVRGLWDLKTDQKTKIKLKSRKDEAGPGTGTYKEYLDDVKGKPGDEGVLSKKDWKELNRQYTDIDPKEKTVKDKFDNTYSGETEVDIRKKGGYDYDPEKDEKSTRKERRDYKKKKEEDFEKMIVNPESEEEAFNRAEEAYNKQREEEESSAL